MFLTKVNLLYSSILRPLRCCLQHLIKQLFTGNFSKNSNLIDSGIYWSAFLSKTNLKLHSIFVTLKWVKKAITSFYLSKASGPDFIPVVVLKNCESELSYIQAELFNMYLVESCFPDCWKFSSVVHVFKNRE